MAESLHLSSRHHEEIEALLHKHIPGVEVWAYGSRVNGQSHNGSDLDLVLRGQQLAEIDTSRLADLIEALQDSTIPFLVEVRDWARLPESFHREIEREHVVLVERAERGEASEWDSAPLEDLVNNILDRRGVTPRKLGSDFVSAGHRVISAKVIKGRRLDLAADESRFVDAVTYQKWMKSPLLADDVILTSEAPVGEPAYVAQDVEWCLGQRLFGIRTNKTKLHGRFLYYALQSEEVLHDLLSRATGTTVQGIRQTELKRVVIPLPPLHEQRAIAYILGTLDDKIELNRRMNETLEAMARALFKSWFVDFDPVRAKMDGRDTGLPKDIADLFPDRMADSELGEIPEGWTVGTLGDIAASPRRGIDPARVASDTPYIGLEHMPRRSVALADWGRAGSVSSNKSAFENRDILFGKLRPYFHKVGIAPVNGVCSTDIVVLDARTPRWSAFVLACVSSSGFVGYTSQTSTGTKMPRTSWHTMSRYELCQPTDSVATAFQRVVSSMLERIVANVHESRTLGVLRDALLPKLVSGELRVNAIEPTCGREGRPASVEVQGA